MTSPVGKHSAEDLHVGEQKSGICNVRKVGRAFTFVFCVSKSYTFFKNENAFVLHIYSEECHCILEL